MGKKSLNGVGGFQGYVDLVLLCTGDCGVPEWGMGGELLGKLSNQVCSVIGQLTM